MKYTHTTIFLERQALRRAAFTLKQREALERREEYKRTHPKLNGRPMWGENCGCRQSGTGLELCPIAKQAVDAIRCELRSTEEVVI